MLRRRHRADYVPPHIDEQAREHAASLGEGLGFRLTTPKPGSELSYAAYMAEKCALDSAYWAEVARLMARENTAEGSDHGK